MLNQFVPKGINHRERKQRQIIDDVARAIYHGTADCHEIRICDMPHANAELRAAVYAAADKALHDPELLAALQRAALPVRIPPTFATGLRGLNQHRVVGEIFPAGGSHVVTYLEKHHKGLL